MSDAVTLDTMDTIKVPIESLVESKNQARKFINDDSFKSMMASFTEVGLVQPITIRPKGDKYEIIVGHRRVKAAKELGWTHIDANLFDVKDERADEMRVVENMHRKGLTPVEEGKEIATLLKKHKAEEVAAILNLSLSQVARRQKLSTLSKEWLKIITKPTNDLDVTRWATSLFEEIARLPVETQDAVLIELNDDWESDSMQLEDLRNLLDSKFLLNLDKVPWDLSEDQINGKISCDKCPSRADCQQSLFEDLQGDNKCLDVRCFEEKTAAMKERMAVNAIDKHGDDCILIDEASPYKTDGDTPYAGRYDFDKCKKSDPGAKRAVNISGTGAGKPIWVRKHGAGNAPQQNGPLDDGQRLQRVEKKRAKWMTEKILALLDETKVHPNIEDSEVGISLVSFIAVFGVSTGADVRHSWFDESSWSHAHVRGEENPSVSKNWCDIFEAVASDHDTFLDTVWNQVRMVMSEHFEYLLKYAPSLREVEFCLGLIKMGSFYEIWYEEAVDAVSLPKSLSKTYDKYGVKLEGIG